jgi:hypothetical protein
MTLEPPVEFPPVRPGEPMVVSGTLYATYHQCPDQAVGRLRGIYGPESPASFRGGLAHRIFARHLTGGPIDDDEFSAACREEIGGSMNPKLASLGLKPSELGRVIEEVGNLYDRFRLLGTEGFRGAEVSLEVLPAEGITLRGSVDAVFEENGGSRLVDWKTGGLGDPGPQLDFYALLWAMERSELPVKIEAVSVATGERFEAVPARSEVDATVGRVAAMIDLIRSVFADDDGAPRIAGPWCRWCPLLDGCDEGRSASSLLDG